MNKLAVIDIGSNSVRLMLWADGTTLYKQLNTTRLGFGLERGGRLSQEAMLRTAEAVAAFRTRAEQDGACRLFAFATAAVRSAKNGAEFLETVKHKCGVDVEVVSGEEEALLGLYGALGKGDGTLFDVGGASTEICIRTGGDVAFSRSYPVGAVRLFEACGNNRIKMQEMLDDRLLCDVQAEGKVVAVGGTATALAAVALGLKEYDARRIQDFSFTEAEIETLTRRLFSLGVEERRNLAGMDTNRADVIAGGALILLTLMHRTGAEQIFVSDRDNLEGYLALRGLI